MTVPPVRRLPRGSPYSRNPPPLPECFIHFALTRNLSRFDDDEQFMRMARSEVVNPVWDYLSRLCAAPTTKAQNSSVIANSNFHFLHVFIGG